MANDILLHNRRVVTGLDAGGRSTILFSDAPPAQGDFSGNKIAAIWGTADSPASNAGTQDAAATLFSAELARGGTRFLLAEYPPTAGMIEEERIQRTNAGLSDAMRQHSGSQRPGMHKTDTLDYVILLRGEMTLIVDTGEVTLKAGDIVIDRGVGHAWENRGHDPALLAAIMIDAIPV